MTGMTPAWFTLSGMYVELPPNILRPTIRRAYWTGIRRWACSMKMTAATMTRPITRTMPKVHQPLSWPTAHMVAGKVAMTWVKIMIDMPLPTPRSVMSSPSHMITAVPAVMVMTMTRNVWVLSSCSRGLSQPCEQVARAGQRDDARRLEQRQAEGEVARVLGDLGLTGLALLLEGLQPRDHHDQQLQDDARRDVGHDPEREHGQLQQRATGEQVDQVVDAGVVHVVDARLDVADVDARGGDLRAGPEDHDDHQDEQQLAPQVRSPEGVRERGQHEVPLFLFSQCLEPVESTTAA